MYCETYISRKTSDGKALVMCSRGKDFATFVVSIEEAKRKFPTRDEDVAIVKLATSIFKRMDSFTGYD